MRVFFRFLLGLVLFSFIVSSRAGDYSIGTYYFPGWKDNIPGGAFPFPWEKLKPHPGMKPLLGWYEEGEPAILDQQLNWMGQYGLSFVVFDWYLNNDGRMFADHAVRAYLGLKDRHGVKFSIMWANHYSAKYDRKKFEEMFLYWVAEYFSDPDYLKIDEKPVVFLFSAKTLNDNAKNMGVSSADLLGMANQIAESKGFKGVIFIGGAAGNEKPGFDYSAASGYGGFSAYNFHGPATYLYEGKRTVSHSYQELDAGYRDQWSRMIGNSDGIYVVPMTSGWNRTPWGGSKDPRHDASLSNIHEFEGHLQAAKAVMDANPGRTKKMGVVCCWNEFGEGSFIEPTEGNKFQYLEKIRDVFGGRQ